MVIRESGGLKVLMAIAFYPRGGSAQVVRYLARVLTARGHNVLIVAGSLKGHTIPPFNLLVCGGVPGEWEGEHPHTTASASGVRSSRHGTVFSRPRSSSTVRSLVSGTAVAPMRCTARKAMIHSVLLGPSRAMLSPRPAPIPIRSTASRSTRDPRVT